MCSRIPSMLGFTVMRIKSFVLVTGSLVFVASLFGQPVQSKRLEFEVATFKPHPPGDTNSSTNLVNGGVDATNVTLRQLIVRALNIQDYQLQGGSSWINDARWDMQARTPDFVMPADPNRIPDSERRAIQEQMQERLLNLLASRFQLVTRREMREQQIYALVVAKGGHKLPPTKTEGSGNNTSTSMSNGRGVATFIGVDMAALATNLGRRTGRPVVDRTGIAGKFDFKLEWTAEAGQPGAADSAANVSADAPPSIFTAVQEQLGLRLESQKGPVEVYFIERAERPSEN